MAQNASNVCKALLVNSKIDEAACSCFHCDIKNASEQRQDLSCSCEDCTEAKTCLYYTKRLGGLSENHSNACGASPPTIKELINTSISQLCKEIKPPTTSPTTPSGDYGVMTATQQQKSIVGQQKRAYLQENLSKSKPKKECVSAKCSCIGDRVDGIMTATLPQQESIVELQKRAYLPASETNPKKKCVLEKCTCVISDPCGNIQTTDKKDSPNLSSAGFVSEVPKIYHMQELPDYLNGAAGYVFDVPQIFCDKQESSEVQKICCHKQESSEVPKICHKQESPDLMKGAAGYVFDVSKICCDKQESSEVPNICHKEESSEVPRICHKQESPDLMRGAAGYVFDVSKICCDKEESSEVPKICHKQESSEVPKIGYKQESLDLMKGAVGYVFDVSKTYKELSKKGQERQCCKENKIERHKTKTINEYYMCNATETCSSSETAQLGSENSTQVFNINKLESKRTTSDTIHICCKTKNESDSQQYKPTKNAQGLFKNILQTQENALKIENTLSGYVYELPKYSPPTQKKSCECREPVKNKFASKNISESSGCVTELQTCRISPHEPANNTRKIGLNRVKAKGIASDSMNKLIKKKSCEEPGYVWEVQKHSPKHYDHKKQKCDCNEFAKYKSDKPGCGVDQKNKINSCALTEPAKRKPKLPECAYDVPICREIDNAERVWKNKKSNECKCKKQSESEPSGYAHELAKCTHTLPSQKKSCACRESVKNKPASPEYAEELTKCTHIPQSQKSSREFRESESKVGKIKSELPGYVFVVPKQSQKSCACAKSAKKKSKSPHEAANNAEVFSINRLESKCIQPDTQNICKSIVGTQTNTIEVLESLDTVDLGQDVLKNQAETITVLQKEDLPQKSKVVSTCCSPLSNLTEFSNNIKKEKNAATQPGNTNLSAEVHMPDAEFNGCLTCRQSNMSNKPKKITKSDIIKRLKEAYKACSCKICDCFASSKPFKTDASKPYECDKCFRSIASHGTNEQTLCSCKPCDCVQCTKSLAEQCHCDPCQCGDCKTRSINQSQRFLVAPVVTEENVPRVACTCSPCACIECGLVYPLASSLVNEMSTSTNRHVMCRCEICLNERCDQSGFDSCKCQKHNKVMSKPVEHDTHEFDIRTASIVHTPMFQRVGRNDTIAMFAAIPSRYPTFDDRLSNTQTCSCKACECNFCVCQKNAINAIKSSQLFSSNKAKSKLDFSNLYNNCELKMPYECQLYRKIQSQDKCCVCDTCECLNCETSKMPENLHRFGRHRNSDGSYERCFKKETSGKVLHPLKKGDVLTPSTHKLKVQNQILRKQHLEEQSCSIPKVRANTGSTSKLRDVNIFHELTPEFNISNRKIGSITQKNFYMNDFNTRYIHKCKTFKCDAYMHYQERNKRRSVHKHIPNDDEISGSCFSDHSSSYYKRYCSNTLISKNKSRESSCNSSGYPEYFMQFPKGTAETSLKDVLKFDMDETIKPYKCKIIQNNTEKHNVDNISCDNMSDKENSFKNRECNHFSNHKRIARPTDSNNNNSENAHIASMRRNCKNSLHIYLNNLNDIHKNCGNNVLQNREINELQNSVCLTGSQSSLKMNIENREYMNAIHDFNKFHVASNVYYNISEGNASRRLFPTHDKSYTWKSPKQTTCSDFVNGVDILNVLDYKRVRNTLMEAKKFSLELIRLLKTYEKANDEFESISEKLKLYHPI